MLCAMPVTVRIDGLGELLDRQFSVASRGQLLELGMKDTAMRWRTRAGGPWQTLLPGVYLGLTGAPNLLQKEMAALLYAGRPITTVAFAIAVVLVAQTSLLVAAFSGHPWQIEMHFYYFAVLAMLSGFCDWRVLMLAAGLISIHHLGLNYILPSAVYPGGSDLARGIVHASFVVIEVTMLTFIGQTIKYSFLTALRTGPDTALTSAIQTGFKTSCYSYSTAPRCLQTTRFMDL